MERLQKVIASCGITSRRKAENLIKEGRVTVNGKKILEMGYQVRETDQIEVDHVLLRKEEKVYYLLNKPRGVISSFKDEKKRKTVVDFIDTDKRIYPVGRLDYDTTGVLLLTNDGDFSHIMMHPQYEVDKVYLAKVEGILKGEDIKKLKDGIQIEDKKVKAFKVKLKKTNAKNNTSFVELTIHEGMNHQVKKMLQQIGFPVLKLSRQRVGIFDLKGLKSGEYRRLTPKEVQKIYSLNKRS